MRSTCVGGNAAAYQAEAAAQRAESAPALSSTAASARIIGGSRERELESEAKIEAPSMACAPVRGRASPQTPIRPPSMTVRSSLRPPGAFACIATACLCMLERGRDGADTGDDTFRDRMPGDDTRKASPRTRLETPA